MQYITRSSSSVQQPRSKQKIILIVTVLLVILGVASLLWAKSSNKAKINQTGATQQSLIPVTDKTYNGKYVSFTYKGIYKEKSHLLKDPGVEQTLLKANTSYDKTLAIEVQPMPANGMAADSGYLYRQMHPELYRQQSIPVAGSSSVEWIKQDGTEETLYIPHGQSYAVLSLSLSGTNNIAGLDNEVASVVQSFEWK
jgi:hypothetical protein